MEERMIDDEYGRGVRMKKPKDGYVDVTDELSEGDEGLKSDEEESVNEDEIAFEFPTAEAGEEDDEELFELTPEEAAALKKRREEEAAARKAAYDAACKEGEELLASGSFKAAELKYEKALQLDEPATDASIGYWRAKTADFTNPDALVEEYVDEGIESLEYDLGYEATDLIRSRYEEVFKRRLSELTAEEEPLQELVEGKQTTRRAILKKRVQNRGLAFGISAAPMLVCLALAVFFGLKNFSTRGGEYIIPTIALVCGFVVLFIVFGVFTNRFINACRMYRKNEKLDETDDGARLFEIRGLKAIYEGLLPLAYDESEDIVDEE